VLGCDRPEMRSAGFQPAVSPAFKSAGRLDLREPCRLKTCGTAGWKTCATGHVVNARALEAASRAPRSASLTAPFWLIRFQEQPGIVGHRPLVGDSRVVGQQVQGGQPDPGTILRGCHR
jgi:hypothetical protein